MSPLSRATDSRTSFVETSGSRFRGRESARELIIADGCSADIVGLLEQADTRWIALGHGTDPVAAISTALAGERLETLHLVAHGRPGGLRIGGHEIDADALLARASLLSGWNVRRIALWVCEAGADSRFVETLARLTGAEVACTDAVIRGGDLASWRLAGDASPRIPFPEAALQTWQGALAVVVDTDGDGVTDGSDADDDNDGILDTVEQLAEVPVLSELVQYSLAQQVTGYDTFHDAAAGFGTGGSEDPKLLFDGDLNTELKVHQGDLFEFKFSGQTLTAGSQFTLTEGTGKNDGLLQIYGTYDTTDPAGDKNNATGGGQAWTNLQSWVKNQPTKAVLLYEGPSSGSVPIVNIPIDIRYIQIVGLQTHGGFGEMSVVTVNATATDTDGDGVANLRDLDSDNDGISDLLEGVGALATAKVLLADTNRDGTISLSEAKTYASTSTPDVNGDGVWDFLAPGTSPVDTDRDGVFDFVDLDSDNDGIPDTVEARASKGYVTNDGNVTNDAGSDGDGVIGLFDTVSGFGGSFSIPVNTDKDGIEGAGNPNYADATSAAASADNANIGATTTELGYLKGRPDNQWVALDGTTDRLVVDLGAVLPAGTTVVVRAGDSKGAGDATVFELYADNWDASGNKSVGTQTKLLFPYSGDTIDAPALTKAASATTDLGSKDVYWADYTFTLTSTTQYLAFTMYKSGGGGGHFVAIDSVQVGSSKGVSDSIPDYLDRDSDNDGFTDQQESGLVLSGSDANGDGLDDSVGGSYQDPDGKVGATSGETVDLTTAGTLLNVDGASDDVDYRSAVYDIQVSNVDVNEAGGYAVFSISGPSANTNVYLSLGLDTDPTTTNATPSSDHSTTVQYWNGTSWTTVNSTTAVLVPGNGEILARVAITNDTSPGTYEGPEVFRLVANYGTGTATYANATKVAQGGYATIYDDGTGSSFAFDNNSDGTPTETTGPGAGFDDDRKVSIDDISVNEGSDYGVFTLTGPAGAELTLSLATTSNFTGPGTRDPETEIGDATLNTDTTATSPNSLWFSVDGGATWSQYNSSTSKPTIPASGNVYVRVGIENDTNFEGREQFRLVSTHSNPSGGTLTSTGGLGTIRDDGNGSYWLGSLTDSVGGRRPRRRRNSTATRSRWMTIPRSCCRTSSSTRAAAGRCSMWRGRPGFITPSRPRTGALPAMGTSISSNGGTARSGWMSLARICRWTRRATVN